MSEYKQVKIGKLKLKGGTASKHKKERKKRKLIENDSRQDIPVDDDAKDHAGWWSIDSFEKLAGCNVCLQTFCTAYVFAVDNGTLVLGQKHNEIDDGPLDEEVFTMIKISERKVAFKSGYGKYISVNARGDILARSEAVGPQEQIEIVIEDEKIALQGHNGYFITVTDDNELKALSKIAKEREIFILRTNKSRSKKKKEDDDEEEEAGNVRQFEINYVKQFQSFGDHKVRLHQGPTAYLEKAKSAGRLHEAMLDRREKMKADRYCK